MKPRKAAQTRKQADSNDLSAVYEKDHSGASVKPAQADNYSTFISRRVIGANLLLLTLIGLGLLEFRNLLLISALCAVGFSHNLYLIRWYLKGKGLHLAEEERAQLSPLMFAVPGLLITPYALGTVGTLTLYALH